MVGNEPGPLALSATVLELHNSLFPPSYEKVSSSQRIYSSIITFLPTFTVSSAKTVVATIYYIATFYSIAMLLNVPFR